MPPKRPSLSQRASEFAESDSRVARQDPTIHGEERLRLDVIALPLREIMPNPRQPRTQFDEAALDELAASIREHGVIQPIIVKAIPKVSWEGAVRRYELIAGERRWRASERAGQRTIPAIIREEATDTALLELALIENLQRADLTPLEEAAAFGQMQRDLGYSYDQIGRRVGKSKGYVMNRMRLLRLDDDLRDLVAERPDTLSHIIHLEKLSVDERAPLLAAVRDNDLSLAETRRAVEHRLAPPPPVTQETPESFLRKNGGVEEAANPELPAVREEVPAGGSFLRKNDPAATDDPRVAIERDVARLRRMVQHWRDLADLPPDDRVAVAVALGQLAGDLADVIQRLQSDSDQDLSRAPG